jgi:hypothetical protein
MQLQKLYRLTVVDYIHKALGLNVNGVTGYPS